MDQKNNRVIRYYITWIINFMIFGNLFAVLSSVSSYIF